MNIAFMAKLGWRLLLEETLWKGKVDLTRFSKRQCSSNMLYNRFVKIESPNRSSEWR